MDRTPTLRPLADRPLNDNYTPARPWLCATDETHTCTGTVVGFVGACPVCQTGVDAEIAAQTADQVRRAALLLDPEFMRMVREEAAMERRMEGRA